VANKDGRKENIKMEIMRSRKEVKREIKEIKEETCR
jgi:hypothetical protein